MRKKGLVEKTTELLRERDVTKPITVPRHVFHISDDEGNEHDFSVRQFGKTVHYNSDDVSIILDTLLEVVQDTLRHGESVIIFGFGGLELKYRKPRTTYNVYTNDPVEIPGRYTPKLVVGNALRQCGVFYNASLEDGKYTDDALYGSDYDEEEEEIEDADDSEVDDEEYSFIEFDDDDVGEDDGD